MIVEGVKITWIAADEAPQQRDRLGFVSRSRYGLLMDIEQNEFGSITRPRRGSPVWSYDDDMMLVGVTVLERIFIVEPE